MCKLCRPAKISHRGLVAAFTAPESVAIATSKALASLEASVSDILAVLG
jgi:hypothetical protein